MRHKKAVINLLRWLAVSAEMNFANSVSYEDWYGKENWRAVIRVVKKIQKLVNEEEAGK